MSPDLDVRDPKADEVCVSIFVSPLGANQFKQVCMLKVKMDWFTQNRSQFEDGEPSREKPVARDGWIDLPQQMGKLRLSSEYYFAQPAPLVFESNRVQTEHNFNVEMTDPEEEKTENVQQEDDQMSGSEDCEASGKIDYSSLPSLDQLLEKNGFGLQFGQDEVQAQQMKDLEEEVVEPNMEFVRQFDKFSSFHRAAGFIEDWIRTKRHNATDYTNDFPAVIDRGKHIRQVLVKMRGGPTCPLNQNGAPVNPEVRNVQQLIFTKNLYDSEEEYVFYFSMQLLEACCIKQEVPQLVIRIMINTLGTFINEGKLTLSASMKNYAKDKLSNLRAEVVFDFVKAMQMNSIVNEDYFFKLAQENIENNKFAEAAIIITKFRFYEKFDILQLILDLVDSKRIPTAKLLIDNQPMLKEKVVRMLSTNAHAKTAADFVKDYKLNPEDFPELQAIISRNSSCYFIGRAFRQPSHADYMPLHKIEDLFTDNHRMLIELAQSLLRRGMQNQAVGVYLRHSLEEHCPESLKQEIQQALQSYDSSQD